MRENLLLSAIADTDSYKYSQWLQYPPNTSAMYSYFESRGGEPRTLFFGLQYILKKYFTTPITVEDVEEARVFAALHGVPFNYEGWMYIATELNGKLPVRIKAVPEGTVVNASNILMSVESTDEKVFWVVSWLETALVRLWYPITVATYSYEIKQIINRYEQETVDDDNIDSDIAFKLHDFGSRGATCQEAAGIGGMAHLINFFGTDTIAGAFYASKFYDSEIAGYSIPASEHSTITMWGKENEADAYRNMISNFGGSQVFACVSDSYDVYNAAYNIWGTELKKEVEKMNATLVVRPDSGDAVKVPCDLVKILADRFGYTVNSKGFKVINGVRVIQGDGIDANDVETILETLAFDGYSAENINFGMGGALLQKGKNRDTHKFAFKCSWAIVDGKEVEVFKQPVTDKVKVSKKGRLSLIKDREGYEYTTVAETANDLLKTVYENGEIVTTYTFEEVRANAKS